MMWWTCAQIALLIATLLTGAGGEAEKEGDIQRVRSVERFHTLASQLRDVLATHPEHKPRAMGVLGPLLNRAGPPDYHMTTDEIQFWQARAETMKQEAFGECIDAWLESYQLMVTNSCDTYREVELDCQGKRSRCVVAPGSTDPCGHCGEPLIVKDEWKFGVPLDPVKLMA